MKTTTSSAAAVALSGNPSTSVVVSNPVNEALAFELPFRQIHLDFHTSEHIKGIGAAQICQSSWYGYPSTLGYTD